VALKSRERFRDVSFRDHTELSICVTPVRYECVLLVEVVLFHATAETRSVLDLRHFGEKNNVSFGLEVSTHSASEGRSPEV
jgi:hypothetical protein